MNSDQGHGLYVCAKCRKPFRTVEAAQNHQCVQMPSFNDPNTSVMYSGPTVVVTHPHFPAFVLDIRNVPQEIWQEVFIKEGV